MKSKSGISFGDNVRVRELPEMKELGLAGKVGQIFGETTPSISGVDVIGATTDDYAVNVYFEGMKTSYWLVEDFVEIVDHSAGSEMSLRDGSSFVRSSSGEWIEKPTDIRRWWEFWKK